MAQSQIAKRVSDFCKKEGIRIPILMAPMAGACPVPLAAAVATAGGMGACGALLMSPDGIKEWSAQMRAASNGAFQVNLWIPDPAPERDLEHEAEVRAFLSQWGPEVSALDVEGSTPDFQAQCAAILEAGPAVVSSIMGVYPPEFVAQMKARGIRWYATATTVAEAEKAEAAGADVIVAQGMEAGGHRGAFSAEHASEHLIGLFSLLPAVVDAVRLPVIATGGIADARGVAAALSLGASAVQLGTGLLRTPEAALPPVWADAIGTARPEDTVATTAFSGRLGRSLRTAYTSAAAAPSAPAPAPYPIQRNVTSKMRAEASKESDLDRMQAWAGQSAGLSRAQPAGDLVQALWQDTQQILNL